MKTDQDAIAVWSRNASIGCVHISVDSGDFHVLSMHRIENPLPLDIGFHEPWYAIDLRQHLGVLHVLEVLRDVGLCFPAQEGGNWHRHRRDMYGSVVVNDDG